MLNKEHEQFVVELRQQGIGYSNIAKRLGATRDDVR